MQKDFSESLNGNMDKDFLGRQKAQKTESAGKDNSMKEPTLGNPQNTIAVLQKYHFTFQKKFGQNFLIDTHVLDKIISAAEIT